MAENSLKIRIRRMLRSCKSKDQITDVVPPPHFSPRFSYSYSLLSPDVVNGRKCPPASPVISNFYDFPKHKKSKRKARYRKRAFENRFPDCKYVNGLFSSDEDDKWRWLPSSVEDSLAVVKRSSDPYTDFRNSMVEMIVEKHIVAAKDLENLLRCFLSLNSYHHHNVIVRAFSEIWEAFFSSNHQ
ncbi:transcription repressor OFP8 [Salvia divinorum]|uniref:Transcription repressor n=1 Tax=Salvia divinorum TaxID=28513 RepID=A0ABD1I4T3_SALDI